MSVLIKDMEIPDSCFHCKLAEVCQHYKAEHYANKRHEDCPLEEVQETHDKRTETHSCDLISRQALCEYALNQKDKSVTPNDIMRFPPAQPESKWIHCSERLPEEDHWLGGSARQFSDEVIVSVANYDDENIWTYISQTIDGEWALELPSHCKIVAWMPLPEPYAERRTDEHDDIFE